MTTDIRQSGINPNHWYVVAQSSEVKMEPVSVTLWLESIVLFRDDAGSIHALADHCPHRQVKLSHGKVLENVLECAYHGWQFNTVGECVNIPYLAENQKLPTCKIRTYPAVDQDGFIWVFPGDNFSEDLHQKTLPMGVPEWNELNYIATVSVIQCQAHYSFLIENLMDMYHGHLHQNWQAWTDAELKELSQDHCQVTAYYRAQSYYKIDKIWSISQLFFPALRQLHPEPLTVSYRYPHWTSTLGQDFKIYCLFCPVDLMTTKAYLVHFTSLQAFWRLHKLPIAFRRFLKNFLFGSAQKLLDGLVAQDVLMIEEEQQAHLQKMKGLDQSSEKQRSHVADQRSYEFNIAVLKTQQVITKQAIHEGFVSAK